MNLCVSVCQICLQPRGLQLPVWMRLGPSVPACFFDSGRQDSGDFGSDSACCVHVDASVLKWHWSSVTGRQTFTHMQTNSTCLPYCYGNICVHMLALNLCCPGKGSWFTHTAWWRSITSRSCDPLSETSRKGKSPACIFAFQGGFGFNFQSLAGPRLVRVEEHGGEMNNSSFPMSGPSSPADVTQILSFSCLLCY